MLRQAKYSYLLGPHSINMTKYPIDIFTDTVAILNLLDLRSIMGCPGALAQYSTAPFGQKENFTVYFSGKRRSFNITSKHSTTIFFSHYNPFPGKLKEKLVRKARVNTEREYRIVLMPTGYPIILLKCNKFNMAAVSLERSITIGER